MRAEPATQRHPARTAERASVAASSRGSGRYGGNGALLLARAPIAAERDVDDA